MTPSPYAEQFNEIADQIEKHKERFLMCTWLSPGLSLKQHCAESLQSPTELYQQSITDLLTEARYCDTTACIGGTAQAISAAKGMTLGAYLNLTAQEEGSLFYNGDAGGDSPASVWRKYADELELPLNITGHSGLKVSMKDITVDHAITMLRRLASGEWTF